MAKENIRSGRIYALMRYEGDIRMKKLGILGGGALAHIFVEAHAAHLKEDYEIVGLYDLMVDQARAGFPELRVCDSMDQLIDAQPDMIVEFAGGGAVRAHAKNILDRGISMAIVSIGALADRALHAALEESARDSGARLYIASGAVGGFDLLRTLALAGDVQFTIASKKPPKGLNGAPCLEGRELSETEAECIFRGNATEAIAAFPKNVNVAVSSSLAADALNTATVEVHSAPGIQGNTHVIQAENAVSRVEISVSSKPDPRNPRSSAIAAWSVAALLKNLASPVQFF